MGVSLSWIAKSLESLAESSPGNALSKAPAQGGSRGPTRRQFHVLTAFWLTTLVASDTILTQLLGGCDPAPSPSLPTATPQAPEGLEQVVTRLRGSQNLRERDIHDLQEAARGLVGQQLGVAVEEVPLVRVLGNQGDVDALNQQIAAGQFPGISQVAPQGWEGQPTSSIFTVQTDKDGHPQPLGAPQRVVNMTAPAFANLPAGISPADALAHLLVARGVASAAQFRPIEPRQFAGPPMQTAIGKMGSPGGQGFSVIWHREVPTNGAPEVAAQLERNPCVKQAVPDSETQIVGAPLVTKGLIGTVGQATPPNPGEDLVPSRIVIKFHDVTPQGVDCTNPQVRADIIASVGGKMASNIPNGGWDAIKWTVVDLKQPSGPARAVRVWQTLGQVDNALCHLAAAGMVKPLGIASVPPDKLEAPLAGTAALVQQAIDVLGLKPEDLARLYGQSNLPGLLSLVGERGLPGVRSPDQETWAARLITAADGNNARDFGGLLQSSETFRNQARP